MGTTTRSAGDDPQPLDRVASARVGRLATIGPEGEPHAVPIVFAVDGKRIVTAIDGKPKRGSGLRRLRNIEANPRVSLLIDHYEEDWGELWWVRVDGRARIVHDGPEFDASVRMLAAKYPQYGTVAIPGPAILIDIERVSGWSA